MVDTPPFRSTVIRGKGRGKGLGFPTLNLVVPPGFDLKTGIYAVWVDLSGEMSMGDESTRVRGALHYGPVPAFEEEEFSLEVHLLDFDEEPPPETVVVTVVERLREVRDFDSAEALAEQIEMDVAQTRRILETTPFNPEG